MHAVALVQVLDFDHASERDGARRHVNPSPGHGGQTKVDAVSTLVGLTDRAPQRTYPARMAKRDRLVDSAFFAFALVAGAMFFSVQSRTRASCPIGPWRPEPWVGSRRAAALWVGRRWPVGDHRRDPSGSPC